LSFYLAQVAILSLACFASCAARAGPNEDSVVGTFDFLYLGNLLEDQVTLGNLLTGIGAIKLDSQAAQPFLMGHKGSVWMMKDRARLLVTATEAGSCGTYGPDASGLEAERLYLANSR
jgi:hypothetical protein